jgi:NtrC-family two-component system response regulator AlgB
MSTETLKGLRVLIVDDERNIRSTLAMCLESSGCTVDQAERGPVALAKLERSPFDLAFLDLRLGAESGLDLLPRLLERCPGLNVVMVTAYGTIDTAVEAMKRGARDFLPKPFTPAQIRHVVERVREHAQLERQVASLQDRLTEVAPEVELSTRSPRMQAVLEQLEKAAAHEVGLLLLGESGTGKGVLARRVHDLSPRRERPFVVVNCPTLSEELLASELFGHAKGAFTGAVRDQAGRVEAVAGGTLFLDEIGEIPLGLQAKLLRFLQDKRFERLGETQTRTADARIIAATNRLLEGEVQAGRFREDLYYRLNAVELALPPLRERAEDIVPLAEGFLAFFSRSMRRRPPTLSEGVRTALLAHPWPGNVRELRNTIERAMIFSSGEVIGIEALPERVAGASPSGPQVGGNCTLDQLERAHVERVVGRAESLDEAARILGIDASTLYRKRKRYEDER